MNKLLLKQALKFVIVGSIAVIVDSVMYYFLSKLIWVELAKGLSFLCGMFFSYILNKWWTFSQKKRSFKVIFKFLVLYVSSLVLNVLINGIVLSFTKSYLVAFFTATLFCTFLNFIGQRWWVYKI
ncbi:GtrA family protein [Paenibacillus polymyxa]|uniref:GtrA family protein n=1 Tax=Paenibacillus polymyxa TaxID=1406 RepID=UPI002377E9C5|nr:GtrA family protein [Paenibacillus polymyxa]WDM21574.1 GtrA family protein [Paenibacillus polymyxa]